MIGVVSYNAVNMFSVTSALTRLGAEFQIISEAASLAKCDKVILPGVGEASSAMASLRGSGLAEELCKLTCPVLGICLGMQVLASELEEGNARGLGIIDAKVSKFSTDSVTLSSPGSQKLKVPHMGWSPITRVKDDPLTKDIADGNYFYFVHSYAYGVGDFTLSKTDYISEFSAIVRSNNFWGVQFHPEKSGDVGSKLLNNFLEL